MTLRAGAFMNWVDDLIDIDLASGTTAGTVTDYRYKNFGRARTLGGQLDALVRIGETFRATLGYAYLWTRDDVNDRPLGGRPPHTLSASIQATLFWEAEGYVRWYAVTDAFVDERTRSPGYQTIDLRLAHALWPRFAELHSGYLQTSAVHKPDALATALVERFGQVRVGVHDDVEVVFGYDWSGPVPNGPAQRIAQVFTSTIALGGYSQDDGSAALATARRQLLRAAYLGTLLAAVDLEKHTVVLTMIGGGVFANPHRDIWDAIHWAVAEVEPLVHGTMTVLVNTRETVADIDREKVRARGGVVVEFGGSEIVVRR